MHTTHTHSLPHADTEKAYTQIFTHINTHTNRHTLLHRHKCIHTEKDAETHTRSPTHTHKHKHAHTHTLTLYNRTAPSIKKTLGYTAGLDKGTASGEPMAEAGSYIHPGS